MLCIVVTFKIKVSFSSKNANGDVNYVYLGNRMVTWSKVIHKKSMMTLRVVKNMECQIILSFKESVHATQLKKMKHLKDRWLSGSNLFLISNFRCTKKPKCGKIIKLLTLWHWAKECRKNFSCKMNLAMSKSCVRIRSFLVTRLFFAVRAKFSKVCWAITTWLKHLLVKLKLMNILPMWWNRFCTSCTLTRKI